MTVMSLPNVMKQTSHVNCVRADTQSEGTEETLGDATGSFAMIKNPSGLTKVQILSGSHLRFSHCLYFVNFHISALQHNDKLCGEGTESATSDRLGQPLLKCKQPLEY